MVPRFIASYQSQYPSRVRRPSSVITRIYTGYTVVCFFSVIILLSDVVPGCIVIIIYIVYMVGTPGTGYLTAIIVRTSKTIILLFCLVNVRGQNRFRDPRLNAVAVKRFWSYFPFRANTIILVCSNEYPYTARPA